MKKTLLVSGLALILGWMPVLAQENMPIMQQEPLGVAASSNLSPRFVGVINPSIDADGVNWMKSITKLQTYNEQTIGNVLNQKDTAVSHKRFFQHETAQQNNNGNPRLYTPQIGLNFDAHNVINSTPPDNTFAISNGGLVITSDNSTIEFYNQNGQNLLPVLISHEDWFDDVAPNINISAGLFDPRALYDPVADRFIFVILHGSNSSVSKLMVCFSQTNDPAGNWNVYELSGNPLSNSCWTDYPHIGISEHDLYITGNLFTNSFGFNQAVVWQMDKQSGYNGLNNVPTVVHSNIPGGNIGAFSLVPASYGQGGEYGPGLYLVSSSSNSGNRLNLYQTTNRATNNPSLTFSANVIVPTYSAPQDAVQPVNNELVATNDSRMQNAFYLNGIVHAVHQVNFQAGYSGIAYYRIPVATPTNTESVRFGEQGQDMCFPAIASFGDQPTDLDVMIGFLNVSNNTFPEMRAVGCDEFMEFSNDVLIRSGLGYVDTWINSGPERWGDYSAMQRRHNATEPAVWFAGCYGGSNNRWRSWISEIKGVYTPPPVPVADFEADTLEGFAPLFVNFTDLSTNNPDSWLWTFEGANPSFSTAQNPLVSYVDTGSFDVSLVASNQYGSDTIVKPNYIRVNTNVPPAGLSERKISDDQLTVYPNPVRAFDLAYIQIDNQKTGHVYIQIVDVQGRTVRVFHDAIMRAGLHQLTFNRLAMSAGTYFVEVVRDGEQIQYEKVLVQ
jgi:hypothetical protein